jgi:hypothetical protein
MGTAHRYGNHASRTVDGRGIRERALRVFGLSGMDGAVRAEKTACSSMGIIDRERLFSVLRFPHSPEMPPAGAGFPTVNCVIRLEAWSESSDGSSSVRFLSAVG